ARCAPRASRWPQPPPASAAVPLRLAAVPSSRGCPPAAEHLEPDLLLGHVGSVLADDLAFVEHEDAVRQREDLVELERDEEDRSPFAALLDESPVQELDRADVEAARRLRRDQHLRIARDLACGDDLLLVSPRERARARQRPAAAHVELADQP